MRIPILILSHYETSHTNANSLWEALNGYKSVAFPNSYSRKNHYKVLQKYYKRNGRLFLRIGGLSSPPDQQSDVAWLWRGRSTWGPMNENKPGNRQENRANRMPRGSFQTTYKKGGWPRKPPRSVTNPAHYYSTWGSMSEKKAEVSLESKADRVYKPIKNPKGRK